MSSTSPITIIVLDPSSPDGESALEHLHPGDDFVALVTASSGPTAHALRQYAESEDLSIDEAAWLYLDHVARRIDEPTRLIETILVNGADLERELTTIAKTSVIRRVLLPESITEPSPSLRERLRSAIAAPLRIARLGHPSEGLTLSDR